MALSYKQSPIAGQHRPQHACRHSTHCASKPVKHSLVARSSVSEPRTAEPRDSSGGDPAAAPQARAAVAVRSWARTYPNAAASAAVFALAALSSLTYKGLSQVELPPLDAAANVLPGVLELTAAAAVATVTIAKLLLRDKFHIELHRGRLYVQTGVPSHGPAINPADCIVTKPTGDVRGNGAYATRVIPAGSHIADYSGELLDKAAFFAKYPDGVGDYAMATDQELVLDAAEHVACTSVFHPVHMNHSRSRANVLRYYNRRQGRVAFFAARNIEPGEELLYDYGRAYWQGREHLELP